MGAEQAKVIGQYGWQKKTNIDYIIDDGLLIKGNRVIAGQSAKRESTRIASVRGALFTKPNHAAQVKKAIKLEKPDAILILGTSLRMVETITQVLQLPELSRIIYIEDVAEEEEIERAKKMRLTEGKHVIPVPTFEIQKDFSGYFIDPLRIFRRKRKDNTLVIADKSVVRPTFSYMGEYTISDQVIYTICEHEAVTIPSVVKLNRLWIENKPYGIVVDMALTLKYGVDLPAEALKVQRKVKDALERYTALNVLSINVLVKKIKI